MEMCHQNYHDSPGYPSEKRLDEGPVAVIECVQEIPCNPCESVCSFNAIIVGQPITNLPVLIEENCVGCGKCVPVCPGLAIFIVDRTYSETEAAISIPYEFIPLPTPGEIVDALDRNGIPVCKAHIISVSNPPRNDKTAVIKLAVPKGYSDIVRNIAFGKFTNALAATFRQS